ncbi:dihydrofolate reductase family protein [Micromonospora sp. WMMA1363]|uniref:dihydrofolate reductase family protein n=1 Tax=Micromonospora sp. WMMA1363 TaxID=3053985 RepID=UPI00259CCD71|nr:dihydrofolate reductase family protein [Micromonospora sp. WMMA1363]MDM4719670.1 dihydrofolate reductase family protein [Micromonospora sp. WMMA1363]
MTRTARIASCVAFPGSGYEVGGPVRKVVSYLLYSLDGVTEEPDEWMFNHALDDESDSSSTCGTYFDSELTDHLQYLVDTQDAILLGRMTYEYWAPYWPNSDVEPFATFINTSPKYVAASTLGEHQWQNTTRIEGSVADQIALLKTQPGKNIGVHGSPTLVRSMLAQGLVDELRLAVPPVVAGKGRRLLDDYPTVHHMRLLESKQTSTGSLLLTYQPGAA